MFKTQSRKARRNTTQVLGLVGALVGAGVSQAHAEGSPRDSLAALVPYDLEGTRTLQALTLLRDQIPLTTDVREKRELEFVRAIALSDLWLIGQHAENAGLLDGVSKAAGVARADVPEHLAHALEQIDDPVVGDIVRDARYALRASSSQRDHSATLLKPPMGLRSEAVFVHAIAQAAAVSGGNVAALANLATDPCANKSECNALYAPFDAQGRKAVRALSNGLSALTHLRAAMHSDPFVEAVARNIEHDASTLGAVELAPSTRLSATDTRAHATQQGSTAAPDIVMFVSAGRAEIAFAPRVHVTKEGKVALHALGAPMLPSTQEVLFSATFPAFVKTVPELVTALTPLFAQAPNAKVSIAAAADAPAHLWARALLSAQAVRFPHIAMLGIDSDGVMRSLEVEIVSSLRAAEVGPRDLNVVVRLGGFTVKQAGPIVTIPRVKKDDGFAFDFDSLLQNANPKAAKSAKLTFMSDVAADTLAETAFSVAPTTTALTVVLP